jgi:hypothetical protein
VFLCMDEGKTNLRIQSCCFPLVLFETSSYRDRRN